MSGCQQQQLLHVLQYEVHLRGTQQRYATLWARMWLKAEHTGLLFTIEQTERLLAYKETRRDEQQVLELLRQYGKELSPGPTADMDSIDMFYPQLANWFLIAVLLVVLVYYVRTVVD